MLKTDSVLSETLEVGNALWTNSLRLSSLLSRFGDGPGDKDAELFLEVFRGFLEDYLKQVEANHESLEGLEATRKAVREVDAGIGVVRYDSLRDMFADLDN